MDKYQYIIWDWNGTLLNDLELSIASINHVLTNQNMYPIEKKQYQEVFGFPIIDYYKRLNFDFEKVGFDVLSKQYMEYYQPKSYDCPLHKDAKQMLSYFQKQGYKQIIISASYYDFLLEQIKQYDILQYFDEIYGLDNMYAHSKKDLAKQFYHKNQAQIKSMIWIGDCVHDYEVAKSIRANCILVTHGHEAMAKLKKTQATVVVSFHELNNLFRK